jgi:hypothetical protein
VTLGLDPVVAVVVGPRTAEGMSWPAFEVPVSLADAINTGQIAHFNLYWSLEREARSILSPIYAPDEHSFGCTCEVCQAFAFGDTERLRQIEKTKVATQRASEEDVG